MAIHSCGLRVLESRARDDAGRSRSQQPQNLLPTKTHTSQAGNSAPATQREKFDAHDIKTLVDKIPERFPWYSEPARS
jgi:hypothetical protein